MNSQVGEEKKSTKEDDATDKRTIDKDGSNCHKRRKTDEIETESHSSVPVPNDYRGFSLQTSTEDHHSVDRISTSDLSPEGFFDSYISKRKPCVMTSLPTLTTENDNDNQGAQKKSIRITKDLLESVAGNQTIQVERRYHTNETFGHNRTADRQLLLTIRDFLQIMSRNTTTSSPADQNDCVHNIDARLLYWSTQEDNDDPFNVPCRQLVDRQLIPKTVPLAGNLILSSCNLWIGKTATSKNDTVGVSSGLHHDYHDNFYLLLQGRKRFRLFSPDCAPMLAVHGKIQRIHSNGRISYVGNEARADGVPLACLNKPETKEATVGEGTTEIEKLDDDEEEEEEEFVLGKGFDYVSEDEDDQDIDEEKDDFDEVMQEENNTKSSETTRVTNGDKRRVKDDTHPDSFSRIDVNRKDTAALENEYPGFISCRQVVVDLNAGEMLYLPAGWFHEVTSFSDSGAGSGDSGADDGNYLYDCHMALNYWYHPPDKLDDFENPYQDDFWKKDPWYNK